MSGRRIRSENLWDGREEKRASAEIHSPGRSKYWSTSEAHDDLMHDDFSRSPSRDPLQGNRNRPRKDDIRRDRNRMYSHQTPDKWEKQYNTHPSDESYDLPYRSRDKGVGGNVRMSREQERTRSPNRSRSRSRSRDCVSRSSRESTRGPRHESDVSYPNMRSNSKDFASRGGGSNMTESWSRRTDYKCGSRYNDNRNTRIPCRYFAAGNCNKADNCKFSHDVPEAAGGYDDNRNSDNRNRTWHNDQQPHDDLNVKSRHGDMEKKSWNSSLWDDVESGGFKGTSRQGRTSDDNNYNNNNTWDNRDDKKKLLDGDASRHAFGSHDVGKSHPNLDNKKTKKWDGPLWDEVSEPVAVQTDDIKVRQWDGPGLSKMASDNSQIVVNDSHLNNTVSENANQQTLTSEMDLVQSVDDMNTQSVSYSNGSEQRHMLLSNPFNGSLNGQGQGMYVHMDNQNKEGGKPLKPLEMDVAQPLVVNTLNETSLTSQLAFQANTLPAEISHKGQLSQLYTESHITNAIDYLKSLPSSAYSLDTTREKVEPNSARNMAVNISIPMGILSGSVTQQNQMPADLAHDSSKLSGTGVINKEAVEKSVAENVKHEEENTIPDKNEAHGKVEEGDAGNDEKGMRQFKVSLVEFVKEILKPKWKEGKMSRDVHKTVVKKVVEKVTSTIQGSQIPRTQPKIDQYLAYSKPKITKLVEAYIERLVKS